MTYTAKAYKQAYQTLDKFSNLFMLYDAAIASLQQVKEAIEAKNIEARYNKIEKAYLIVSGLRDCLDVESGEEVAQTLKDWYTGVAYRILSINSSEDLAMCDLCIKHLKEMREAWVEAKATYEQESVGNDNEGEPVNFLPDMTSYFNNSQNQPMALSV